MSKDEPAPPTPRLDWLAEMERAYAAVASEGQTGSDAFPHLSDAKRRKRIRHLNTEASQAIGANDHRKALELYERVLQLDPRNLPALTSMGNLHTEQGDYAQAANCFWAATEEDETYEPALVGLGRLLIKQNELDRARKKFRDALRTNPRDHYALTGLGKVFGKLGMTRASEDQYRQAVAIDGGDFVARAHLGLLLYESGRHREAYGHFKDVLWADRGNKVAAFLKAQIDVEEGDVMAARHTLVSALDRSLDESCLVFYFSITSAQDEGHRFYADKIGPERYRSLQGNIDLARQNPHYKMMPHMDDEIDNNGVLQTLIRGTLPAGASSPKL